MQKKEANSGTKSGTLPSATAGGKRWHEISPKTISPFGHQLVQPHEQESGQGRVGACGTTYNA